MTKLKPCPFCGHHDIQMMIGVREDRGFSLLCGGCGIRQGSQGRTREQAIAAWNTRADSQAELVEALEKIERHCGARGLTAVRGIARAALAHVKGEKA